MQIIKPLQLSSLHRTFSYCGRHIFSVGVVEAFRLDTGETILETDFWPLLMKLLPAGQPLDAAMPKDRAEYLAIAHYFSPEGRPVKGGKATIQIGTLKKTLYIFGDRQWRNIGFGRWTITEPVPFTDMPIDYVHAFGGAGIDTNPEGKGAAAITDENGLTIDGLPNIENPAQLITAPNDQPFPAGFSNIPPMWPIRLKKAGTYDERWQKERAPGLADDVDWTYFNEAPADQWFEEFLKGDERFCFEHLHPQQSVLQGKLPGHVARCFIRRTLNENPVVEEIRTRIDTVFFVPHENLGIVIHRGTLQVNDDMGRDIAVLMLAYENARDTPRSLAHYETELIKRSDPRQSYKYALYTVPLIPEGAPCGFAEMQNNADYPLDLELNKNLLAQGDRIRVEAEEKMKTQLAAQQDAFNAQLQSVGHPPIDLLTKAKEATELDPVLVRVMALIEEALPKVPGKPTQVDITRIDLEKIDEVKRLLDQYAADQQVKMRRDAKARLEEALRTIEETHGANLGPAERAQIEEARLAMSAFDKPAPLPRPATLDSVQTLRKQIEATKIQIEELRALGVADVDLPKIDCDIDAIERQITDAAPRIKAAYLIGAHEVPYGAPPHAGREHEIREQLLADWRAGKNLRGRDLAGLDLSGLNLAGIDLGDCYLEDVSFEGTVLQNAVMDTSIMPRARLRDADFSNGVLTDANVGASDLSDANLSGVQARKTRFSKAKLFSTNFSGSSLGELPEQFLASQFKATNFSTANLEQPMFLELALPECNFSFAKMENTGTFIGCNLDGVNYQGLVGYRMVWADCTLENADFQQAQMNTFCFVGACRLNGVQLSRANMSYGNFRGMPMQKARAEEARLVDCDFGEADLSQAMFSRSDLSRSQFMQSQLFQADLNHANLMEGSLFKAYLVGANFGNANLYSVNFMQCTLGDTRFQGANLDATILRDWRP